MVQQPIFFTFLPSASNEPSCIKDRDTKIDEKADGIRDAKKRFSAASTQSLIKKLNQRKRSSSANPVKSITADFKNVKLTDKASNSIPIENAGLDQCTGLNGEQMVYEFLQHKYSSQIDSISIKWENEHGESNLPYDILLIDNGKKHYIEVITSRSINRHSFKLSLDEIKAILEYRENYFIYRVFLEEKKLIVLDNIRHRLKQNKQLTCILTFKPLPSDQIHTISN